MQAINPTAQGDGSLRNHHPSTPTTPLARPHVAGGPDVTAPITVPITVPVTASQSNGVEPPGFEGPGGNGGLVPNGGWGEGGAGGEVGAGLAAVPAFYFEGTFRLGDLATFERTGAATEDAEAARLLQEHLSEHLDTVEHVLMREIQARSHAFYRALDTLHQLYSQVCVCV